MTWGGWHGMAWHSTARHAAAHRHDPLHGLQLERVLVAVQHLLEVIVPAPYQDGKSHRPFLAIFIHFYSFFWPYPVGEMPVLCQQPDPPVLCNIDGAGVGLQPYEKGTKGIGMALATSSVPIPATSWTSLVPSWAWWCRCASAP